MKKYLSLLLFLVVATMPAASQFYFYEDTTEHNIAGSLLGTASLEIPLDKPGELMTLSAKHTASSVTTNSSLMGNLTIDQYVDGEWETIYEDNPGIVQTATKGTIIKITYEESVDYEQLTITLNRKAETIRFKGSTLNDKQVKDIRIKMASFVEMSPRSINMGELGVWEDPDTAQFVVEHCNVARLSISSSTPDFSLPVATVQRSGIGEYHRDTFDVVFTPTRRGTHTSTIIVSNGTQTDSIHVSATVSKRTPRFEFSATTLTVGDTIETPFASDCSNQYLLASCQSSIAEISCGMLIAREAGEATITAMQLGDEDYWNNRVEVYNVTVNPAPIAPTAVSQVSTSATISFDGKTLTAQGDNLHMLEIYDLQGNLLEVHEGSGNISTRIFLPTGCYLAVCHSGQSTHSEKFIVE